MLHSCKLFSWLRTVSLKNAQHESCKLHFIWGQNEDYSSADSTSDSSEELFQRGRGEGQYTCDFGKGRVSEVAQSCLTLFDPVD